MDQTKFQEAQQAYDTGDYRTAAKGFLAAAGRGSVGNGAAYHMAGNSLMRLRRYADAVTVYGHALRDETYDKRGVAYANLGAAYKALGELSEAITAYEAALEEPGYPYPYKAWQGIAAAQLDRGRVEEAAGAFRRAALEEGNPDPGKALVNLGLCFMALGRPSDAADAYQAALGFDDYDGRGKALANLGQAYAAMGRPEDAIKAFDKATKLHGHALSPAAEAAYASALASRTSVAEQVEGWETGEMPVMTAASGGAGWNTGDLAALGAGVVDEPSSPAGVPEADKAAEELGFGDDQAVSDFFSRSEQEMKERDREARRADRGTRLNRQARLAIVVGSVIISLVLLLSVAYLAGLGWPTQRSTVNGMFVAYSKGEPVEKYWVAVPEGDVAREMAKVPPVEKFTIDEVDRGRDVSAVAVTVTPKEGGTMRYVVRLSREGVGWRVDGLDYNWRSTGG